MAPHFFYQGARLFTLTITVFVAFYSGRVKAQGNTQNSTEKTYAVIGAFSVEKNASRLVDHSKQLDLQATYKLNVSRNLFYVIVDESYNHAAMVDRVVDLKQEFPQFYDAWAYTGALGALPGAPKLISTSEKPRTNSYQERMNDDDMPSVESGVAAGSPVQSATENTESDEDADNESVANSEIEEVEAEKDIQREPPVTIPNKKENHYYLYLNTINTKNYKEVKGRVKIIDPERAKQLKVAKSHEIVELEDPDNGTRRVILSTDIFGFKEIQHIIDLDNPETEKTDAYVDVVGDSIIVNFDLQRFKKGDVLIMYNVYFFKDAAIMRPESVYELNSLLDMLKENKDLVVEIHGHTNGNSHGKIIHLDMDDKNFFSLGGDDHKESNGSAKKLSEYRAYTIQHWLMEQGIDKERMDIKGWGGKKMIYDKFSTQADKNVRVEIEILEE